jgi:dihydroflavonol-4-reductase
MIAVTGANGLLGSFLVRRLLQENTPFVALKRAQSDLSLLQDVASQIQWRDADINDPLSLQDAFQDVEGVIHTAAVVSFNPRDKKKIFEVNVEGTRNVVDACLGSGVKRLLHVSSVAALGRTKGQSVTTENNKWVASPLNSTYGESKYLAELEVFRGEEEGLSTIIINPSVILAPANWNNSSARLFRYVWDEKAFYIDGSLNYVDVRDVVNVMLPLYNSTARADRFIVNAGNISFKEFFDKIADHFSKKSPSIKLNKDVLGFIARMEAWRSAIFRTEPMITRETARLADTFFWYDNQKVKKALGVEFQSIEATLAWCCSHYSRLNAIKSK